MINENETVKVNVGITQTSKEGEMQTSDDENEFNGGITQKARETEILISDDENQFFSGVNGKQNMVLVRRLNMMKILYL